MIYKRCKETVGCSGVRCEHPWYVHVMHRGEVERGPVKKYAFLLDPVVDGSVPQLPRTKEEAEELEGRVRTWMVRGRPKTGPDVAAPPPKPKTRTIAEACDAYLTNYVRPELRGNGDEGIVQRIRRECGDRPLEDLLDRAVVRAYLGKIAKTAKIAANRNYSRWSHLVNWCRVEYQLDGPSPFYHRTLNPQGLQKNDEGNRTRRLRDGEEDALVAACARVDDGGMMLGRLYCALDTGLRRGEMLSVQREHVERSHGDLALRVYWETSKAKKSRVVPVTSDRLIAFLSQPKRRFARYVFGQVDGTEVTSFRTDWENVLLDIGLAAGEYVGRGRKRRWVWSVEPDLTWHDLRHECGSRLAEGKPPEQAPMPLTEIQVLLGHSSLATTQKYLNPTQTSMAANMRRLHRAFGL